MKLTLLPIALSLRLVRNDRQQAKPFSCGVHVQFPQDKKATVAPMSELPRDCTGILGQTICNLVGLWLLCTVSGCYAPMRSPGIPANQLPDSFRYPFRSLSPPLNLASLTAPPVSDYILGANDVLEVTVPDLFPGAEVHPLQVQVMASGEVQLPLTGKVQVGGLNLLQAMEAITKAYSDGALVNPTVNVSLAEKSSIPVLVLGGVVTPGIMQLEKYQNDVGHALAAAGGFSRDAAEYIEVHRRVPTSEDDRPRAERLDQGAHFADGEQLERYDDDPGDPKVILRIPMRGLPPGELRTEDVVLQAGDVVFVPDRSADVFWVVGQLAPTRVAFSVGDRERELGAGLVLPKNRDIDVLTAVAMAGYIDPIHSPTTVTVHRRIPDGDSLLIRVDLIAARYDSAGTVLVQAGDIIYVNPDMPWWLRRQWDRVVTELILSPYRNVMLKSILGRPGT